MSKYRNAVKLPVERWRTESPFRQFHTLALLPDMNKKFRQQVASGMCICQLPSDADDVYVEIGCYQFQPGDFTWEQICSSVLTVPMDRGFAYTSSSRTGARYPHAVCYICYMYAMYGNVVCCQTQDRQQCKHLDTNRLRLSVI
jgi:hypothetical protein